MTKRNTHEEDIIMLVKDTDDQKIFSVRLPTELVKRLKLQSVQEGRPMTEIVSTVIEKYLKEQEKT